MTRTFFRLFVLFFLLSTTAVSRAACTIQLQNGWNLIGSSVGTASVARVFGDKTKVQTVWKWNTTKGAWTFYTPLIEDGGVVYAVSRGYDSLTAIAGGEGMWVNASAAFPFDICVDRSVEVPSPSGSNTPVLPPGDFANQLLPVNTAKEAKSLYEKLPSSGILSDYFQTKELNPEMLSTRTMTEATKSGGFDWTVRLIIVYKGIEIYNNVTYGSYYTSNPSVRHGFLNDGTYVMLVADESHKIFLNGVLFPLKTQHALSQIKEINDSWWVMSTNATPLREMYPHFHEWMSLFNRHTGEVIELGEYPCQGPQFRPCS